MSDLVVGLVTGPERPQLVRMGRTLVEEGLVACLNVLDPVTSVYRWEGQLREETEALGLLKTTAARSAAAARRIRELHPYDVPEIIFLPVTAGSKSYVEWVSGEVGGG